MEPEWHAVDEPPFYPWENPDDPMWQDDFVVDWDAVDDGEDEKVLEIIRDYPVPRMAPPKPKPGRPKGTKKQCEIQARRNRLLTAYRLPGFSCEGDVGSFIDSYLACEYIINRLAEMFYADVNRIKPAFLSLKDMNEILRHFNLLGRGPNQISYSDLGNLFSGGGGTAGQRSAKQLRNAYLHNIDDTGAKCEIVGSKNRLRALMTKFRGLRISKYCC